MRCPGSVGRAAWVWLALSPPLFSAQSVVAPPAMEAATEAAPQVGYDNGFFLRSADRENELVIKGLFQFGANVFDEDRDPSVDFDVRRMRLEFSARFADVLRAHVEPNFLPEGTEMEEAWLGLEVFEGEGLLMFGRMKAPFGLEEVRSRRWIDFPRFSILNQFAPAEDHGVFLNGTSASKRWEYGLAAYNGTGTSDTNASKDVAARAMMHPFVEDEGSAFENLQLGVAGTLGRQDADVGGDAIANELGLAVSEFAAGTRLDGTRTRLGLEAAWFRGPWFVQAEYALIRQSMSLAAVDEDVDFHGGYVDVARVLTGEAKTWSGVEPHSPYDFRSGSGRGAWVLAARWSDLSLDDALADQGLVIPGTFTDRIQTASIGLNWIPNRHVMVRHAFVHTWYNEEVDLGDGADDDEDAFMIELQLSF